MPCVNVCCFDGLARLCLAITDHRFAFDKLVLFFLFFFFFKGILYACFTGFCFLFIKRKPGKKKTVPCQICLHIIIICLLKRSLLRLSSIIYCSFFFVVVVVFFFFRVYARFLVYFEVVPLFCFFFFFSTTIIVMLFIFVFLSDWSEKSKAWEYENARKSELLSSSVFFCICVCVCVCQRS